MAQNGRFGLSVRVLGFLALAPDSMHTSAAIAESLKTSPVMVRRVFAALHKAGFIVQRKGPQGGARLKISPPSPSGSGMSSPPRPARGRCNRRKASRRRDSQARAHGDDAVAAMNETSIGSLAKKLKKA